MRILCFVFLALPVAVLGQDMGPIETRNHQALSIPFLRLDPRGDLLKRSQSSVSVGVTDANDLKINSKGSLLDSEDYEIQRILLRYRKGLGKGLELGLDLPFMFRDGGFMDPIVNYWHEHVLGIEDNLHSFVPNGQSQIIVPGSPRFGSTSGLCDVSGTIAKQIAPRLIGEFALKLPTGNPSLLTGTGSVDAAIDIQAKLPFWRKWVARAQLGGVYQGKATDLQSSRSLVDQEAIAIEFLKNSRDEFILQWQSERSAIVTGIPQSDSKRTLLTIGYHRRINDKRILEVFFSDNGDWSNYSVPAIDNIGPEPTIGFRIITIW